MSASPTAARKKNAKPPAGVFARNATKSKPDVVWLSAGKNAIGEPVRKAALVLLAIKASARPIAVPTKRSMPAGFWG